MAITVIIITIKSSRNGGRRWRCGDDKGCGVVVVEEEKRRQKTP